MQAQKQDWWRPVRLPDLQEDKWYIVKLPNGEAIELQADAKYVSIKLFGKKTTLQVKAPNENVEIICELCGR